ncbi:MAG: hypothetical protein R3C46_07175 [Hyphomonadaceae bacterium]
MTETFGQPDIGSRIVAAFQRFFGFLGKAGFGVFLVAAAIFTLFAATFIGLMLAIAAVFLSFARPRRRATRGDEDGAPQTLEARRTADGWVIEL